MGFLNQVAISTGDSYKVLFYKKMATTFMQGVNVLDLC